MNTHMKTVHGDCQTELSGNRIFLFILILFLYFIITRTSLKENIRYKIRGS